MRIWNEFYRPKDLDSMIMPDEHRQAFNHYITSGLPNVIFYGNPGSGKTTTALILIKVLDAEHLRLNGSDSRGIDIIREQIKNFIQTRSFNKKRKIVFLDESEKLTPDAFGALKEITERYYETASFIFATNSLYKFPEAIRSRCTLFEFKKPTKTETIKLLTDILIKEAVDYELETLEKVYRSCGGDLRKSINYLQRYSISGKLELPEETFGEIYKIIKGGNLVELKRYFAKNSCDWDGLYRFLFEHVEDPTKAILLAKYTYQSAFVVDQEINFVGFVAELQKINNK